MLNVQLNVYRNLQFLLVFLILQEMKIRIESMIKKNNK